MLTSLFALRVYGLLAWIVCTASYSFAQTPEEARRVGQFYAKSDGFSGVVVLVRDGVVTSRQSYGLASEELRVPIASSTRFAIGSVSKQFTAASILLLQEQGLLKTSDTLAQHYPLTPAVWKDITLRQLLQHTSGIPDAVNVWGAAGKDLGEPTPEQLVTSAASRPLVFQPGSRMEYNNMGYVLLGLVIETVSKQSLAAFLQQHFFGPLDMKDTALASSRQIIPQMATGYEPAQGGLQTASPVAFTSIFAAGSIYSTGDDLAKWMTALHGGQVLKPASYTEMTSPGPSGYAYALNISTQSGKLDISHNGMVSGFASQTDYFPESKTGVILLSNHLSRKVSPGEAAIETDLMHLVTESNPAVRSLGTGKTIDSAILARYTGTFVSSEANVPSVSVELQQGRLTLTPKGKNTSTLIARSDHEFYMKEWDGEAEFVQQPDKTWMLHIFSLPTSTMITMTKSTPASKVMP